MAKFPFAVEFTSEDASAPRHVDVRAVSAGAAIKRALEQEGQSIGGLLQPYDPETHPQYKGWSRIVVSVSPPLEKKCPWCGLTTCPEKEQEQGCWVPEEDGDA